MHQQLECFVPFWAKCIMSLFINKRLLYSHYFTDYYIVIVSYVGSTQELQNLKALLFKSIGHQAVLGRVVGTGQSSSVSSLSLQACSYTHEQIVEMMEFLIEYGPAQLYWEPAEVFLKLSCVQLLLQLISIACNWKTYYARWDKRGVSDGLISAFARAAVGLHICLTNIC